MAKSSSLLSEREQEVLQLLVTGATNLQIARQLLISPNTVKVHLRNIYEKMGVQSRTEASMVAVREGWIDLGGAEAALPAATPRTRPAIVLWQRIYLSVAIIAVVASFLVPLLLSARGSAGRANDFSDSPIIAEVGSLGVEAEQWFDRASMPQARSRFALVPFDGKLYAIAGATPSGVTNSVEVYDPQSNGWLPGATKPTAVSNVAGVELEGLILVPGGYIGDGGLTNALEAYDPQQETWLAMHPMPEPLCAYALTALEHRLIVFGGWNGKRYVPSVHVYDLDTDRWTSGTPMSQPRGFAAAATIGSTVYVAGGYDGIEEYATLEAYDWVLDKLGGNPWSSKAPMSAERGGLGLGVTGEELYAIGGGWRRQVDYNERYDASSDTWSTIPTPLAGSWRNLSTATLDGRIFAMGGWSSGMLHVNQEYRTLFFRIHLPLGEKAGSEQ